MNLKTKYYQLEFENAAVRWIKSGNTEIVRMIYSALRDQNWGTVEPKILSENVLQNNNGFEVKAVVEYQKNNIHFQAEYKIIGDGKTLSFEMIGEALSTFQTCRVGFCVLHPIKECAGKNCTVVHPDGSGETAIFPKQISPDQPMKNVAGMEWQPAENISARLKFQGDVFETEDQRNWTDASYKTYCRSLNLPFPFGIKKGEKIIQQIILEIEGDEISDLANEEIIQFNIDKNQTFKLPELGVCNTSREEPITRKEVAILKELPLFHLRAELKLFQTNWKLELTKVVAESDKLNLPLFLVLYFSENWENERNEFKKLVAKIPVKVKHVLVVGKNHLPDNSIFKEVQPGIKKLFPDAKIGSGVNAYFAELNRNRPKSKKTDFINFTISPQVHAFDNASLVENMEAQKYAVESAQSFFPGLPIYISPLTLKQRFNVVATSEETPIPPGELPPQVDVRQNLVFAAQWLLGSLKFVAQSGAELATFFETVGWRGFIQGDFEPSIPEKFSAKKGDVFPVYQLLKELVGFDEVLFSESRAPVKTDGIVLQSKEETKLLMANFTDDPQEIIIYGLHKIDSAKTLFGKQNVTFENETVLPPNSVVVLRKKRAK